MMYEVMIVDDDPTSLAIGRALLEPSYKIILMKSGVQALGYIKNNPAPDILLLDMVMPGTSGLDVLKALKEDKKSEEIPVIFLTSMDDNSVQLEGYRMGAVDFLQKPVNPELLKKKIAHQTELLHIKRENQHMRARIVKLENTVRQCANLLNNAISG